MKDDVQFGDSMEFEKKLQSMNNDEVMDFFCRGLLKQKNLGEMDDETTKDMVADLKERLADFINRAVLEQLPKDKLDEINNAAENGEISKDQINKMIQESTVDMKGTVAAAMEKFGQIYLEGDKAEA